MTARRIKASRRNEPSRTVQTGTQPTLLSDSESGAFGQSPRQLHVMPRCHRDLSPDHRRKGAKQKGSPVTVVLSGSLGCHEIQDTKRGLSQRLTVSSASETS